MLDFDSGMREPARTRVCRMHINTLKQDIGMLGREISAFEKDLADIDILDKCPSCGQLIDTSHQEAMQDDYLQNNLNKKLA